MSNARDPQDQKLSGVEHEFGVPFAGEILAPDRWANTAIKRLPNDGPLDLVQVFGRDSRRVLDIGCGNGRFVLASAVRRPEVDHVGIDILPMVMRYATRRANQRGLHNTRWVVADGHRFLAELCVAGQLHEIHVYHPQPFPDPRDHHRRLFTHEFLWLIQQSLAPGGQLFVQTDNPGYWKYLQTVLSVMMVWHEQSGGWPEDPQGRTRREIVALHKGLRIFRGWAQRRDDLDQAAFLELCASLPPADFDATQNQNPNRWRRPSSRRMGKAGRTGKSGRPPGGPAKQPRRS